MSLSSKILRKFSNKGTENDKDKEALRILSGSDTQEKIRVASDPNSSIPVLNKAMQDRNPDVRIAVVSNPSAHDKNLIDGLRDDDERVFQATIHNNNIHGKLFQMAISSLRADVMVELKQLFKSKGVDYKKYWKWTRFIFPDKEGNEEEFEIDIPRFDPEMGDPPSPEEFGMVAPPNIQKVMRIVDYISRFLKDPSEYGETVSTNRRELKALFGGKYEVSFKDIVKFKGGKGQAEDFVRKMFGEDRLNSLKQGEDLEYDEIEGIMGSGKANVTMSDIEYRYGEQAVGGNEDEYVTFDSTNTPQVARRFWDAHKKNQLVSGHPPGAIFVLFKRFDDGKSALITQIQSDLFSILQSRVKRAMLNRMVPDRVLNALEDHWSDLAKDWPIFAYRNAYRKLRDEGVEKIYMNTEEGLKKIGANPPKSVINTIASKKFAKKEGFGEQETIKIGNEEMPVYGHPSPEADKELRESLAERLQSLIIDIVSDKKPQAGMLNTGYGTKQVETPKIQTTDAEVMGEEPLDVEGFDVSMSNHTMQSLFTDAIHASDGGYRLGESVEEGYYPSTIGFARRANKDKVVEIPSGLVYNSRSDALDKAMSACESLGFSSGALIRVSYLSKGKYRVRGVETFTVTK